MDDLISKLSGIRSQYNCFDEAEEPYYRALSEAIEALSAQPEKRTEERTETHACDLIDRQTAVDALRQYIVSDEPYDMDENTQGFNDGISCAILELSMQTSAQPSGKDPIEREAVVEILHDAMQGCSESEENLIGEIVCKVDLLPSAQPYTEDEIQKIQDLEQAQLDKMYELGKQTAQAEIIHCRECKHHIDGFFCQKANHHTSDTECCASVFGAERMEE